MPLACVLTAIAAYLLGSIPTGLLLVRIFHKQDVRASGSGNIGATNVLRSHGKSLGAATFILDCLKGCAAVWLGTAIWASISVATYAPLPLRDLQALAALFCVVGHVFPVWLRFKGGKGVATGFGVFLVAAPWAALAAIAVFIVVLYFSRYVSLGSIIGAASFPVFAWFLVQGDRPLFFLLVQAAVALIIILKHQQNIARLLAGKENRIGAKKQA